jgi:hypothetical protein
MADFQLEAQRRAARALAYATHLPAYVIAENQIAHLGEPKLAILPSPQAMGEKAWNAILTYVKNGGTLLVTGPVDRDEHWQIVQRSAALGIAAHAEPLVYHNAEMTAGEHRIPMDFGQQQQNWLDSLRFEDGATLKEVSHGKGRIYWAAYPVELSENLQSTAALYSYVTTRLNLVPSFTTENAMPPGVLVFPTLLADSIVYVLISDSADDTKINLRDRVTGVALALTLRSQHAAIAVIGTKEKKIIASYGF